MTKLTDEQKAFNKALKEDKKVIRLTQDVIEAKAKYLKAKAALEKYINNKLK